jgi:multisubunit Na+/H+ antiporter MnhC subunit
VNQLELRQPRDVGGLFRESLGVFLRHAWLFILLSAAVVIPVEIAVEGIGLEMLWSSYDESPSIAETAVPTIVGFLVMTPIITAICIYALHAIASGERPSPGQVFVSGFEAFTPLFAAVVLAAIGIAIGFLALIVPGVYLAVRWYFVPQTVVIEEVRGPAALTRSSQIVQGFWWRTLGLVLLANLAIAIPGFLLLTPFTAIAASSDQAVWALVGTILTTSVTTPFVALYSTLLYYDLRDRKRATAAQRP